MNIPSNLTAPCAGSIPATDLTWLLGQPHLSTYLDFVAAKVIGGETIDPRLLVEEWRRANDLYYALEQSEAGIADTIACLQPEHSLASRIAAVTASPWFRHSFDNLPTEILKVELDKLIVSQIHVERGHSYYAAEAAGERRSAAALFDVCLPLDRPLPPVRTERLGGNRYRFSSPSTDFRAHRPRLIPGELAASFENAGPTHQALAVAVGFGSNFMSAIRSNGRLVLQNGYHRAYALRAMGVTHAYCVVETVTRKDELRLTASPAVSDDPEFYFAAARPPLLKDFFDPGLAKPLAVYPIAFEVEIELTIRSANVTERG